MKEIIKRTTALALAVIMLTAALATLSACGGKKDETPEGLQLVRGGEEYGYNFWGPEGWIVANQGAIASSYVSSIDYSSITFTPVDDSVLEGEVTTLPIAAKRIFDADAVHYEDEPFSEYKLIESGKECTFGNAAGAYKRIFSYVYGEKPYTCMQIISSYGGELYLFTYNASSKEYVGHDASFYDFYLTDYVQKAIDSFEFTEKRESDDAAPEYERDDRGYLLVSDRAKAGFKLYVPESYTVDYSSAIVSVSREGCNINMTRLVNNTISIKDNYLERRAKLSLLADKANGETTFTELKGVKVDENGKESLHVIELSNTRSAAEFEYTYTLFGKTYHVYQVFVIQGHLNMQAFVYTFTAEEDLYAERIDEAKAILEGIGY